MAKFGKGHGAPMGNRNAAGKHHPGTGRVLKTFSKYERSAVTNDAIRGAISGTALGALKGGLYAGPAGVAVGAPAGAMLGAAIGAGAAYGSIKYLQSKGMVHKALKLKPYGKAR